MINPKRIFILFITAIILFYCPLTSSGYSADDYVAYPVSATESTAPNILVVLDYSGSMLGAAYGAGYTPYDSSTTYYGYFDTTKYYEYGTNTFVVNSACTDTDRIGSSSSCMSGNLLNFGTMSKIDLLRKALMGGKATPRSSTPNTLIGEAGSWNTYVTNLKCHFRLNQGSLTVSSHGGGICPIGTFSNRNIDISFSGGEKRGIVQNLMDRDGDGVVDKNAPRFGLMVYGGKLRKGVMRAGIDGASFSSFIRAVESERPGGKTPTGEALYEAIDYFKQSNDHNHEENAAYVKGTGSAQDPLYDVGSPRIAVPCRKNFVLLISDGVWNGAVDPVVPAREGLVADIRTDSGMPGFQNIELFGVYIFGSGEGGINSIQQAAMFGGFDDYDKNKYPYNRLGLPLHSGLVTLPAAPCLAGSIDRKCSEWDKNSDGLPDNYYEATSGTVLEEQIISAILNLLDTASSGAAISRLSTSYRGAGFVHQSYFLPFILKETRELSWTGHLLSFKIDEHLRFRDVNDDKFAFSFDRHDDSTFLLYDDSSVVFNEQKIQDWGGYIWDAGNELKKIEADRRKIVTFADKHGDGSIGANERVDFTATNSATLNPFLDPDSFKDASEIIEFVRGKPVAGCRERTFDNAAENPDGSGEWKLGDIIHSTPVVVSAPSSSYHITYSDSSYAAFFKANKTRDNMIYAGANDGMLHAFDATTGKESWAYIPNNLLPHLKWLTKPGYNHSFYVDLPPTKMDVNFSDTGINGWKTILVGGMRFGGGAATVTNNFKKGTGEETRTFRSAYFALDVTDPSASDNPRILWEFTHKNLGFTTSKPAIAKVGNSWFIIIGSGPDTDPPSYEGISSQAGRIFVLDATNTAPWEENKNFWIIPTGTENSFMGDPVVVDIDIVETNEVTGGASSSFDYNDEAAYIGETFQVRDASGKWDGIWRGNLWRLAMNGNTDPAKWILKAVFDGSDFKDANGTSVATPVLNAPAVALDEQGNIWVYFGGGRYWSGNDRNTVSEHAFFGIKDSYFDTALGWSSCWTGTSWSTENLCSTTSVSASSELYNSIQVESVVNNIVNFVGGSPASKPWDEFLAERISDPDTRGWYLTLKPGNLAAGLGSERPTTKPKVISGVTIFPTFAPESTVCSFGGSSQGYFLCYQTGTPCPDIPGKIDLGYGAVTGIFVTSSGRAIVSKEKGDTTVVDFPLNIRKSRFKLWDMEQR